MGQNLPNCARSVPEVCPRQTHSNSLQPTQTNLEAIFDCFQDTSRLSIEGNCIAGEGSFVLGKTISHYKVLEKIGQGGMGEVDRAEDTKMNWDVAISGKS